MLDGISQNWIVLRLIVLWLSVLEISNGRHGIRLRDALMRTVASRFEGLPFVSKVEIIPPAYMRSGDHNSTQTLMDGVVMDIESRKLLFRAPGTSTVSGLSTAAGVEAQRRQNSSEGFELATQELIVNLERELEHFKVRIRDRPSEVRVSHRPGYSEAGGFQGWLAMLLAGVLLWARRRRG